MNNKISTVIFDLDGTLADTSIDLTESLNQLFLEKNKNSVTVDEVKSCISKGSSAMLKLRLDLVDDSNELETVKQQLFSIYSQKQHLETALFDGMESCLTTLEQHNIKWGIVTNKLLHLAEPVIHKLQLQNRTACLICPDIVGHAKPHPAPLLHAAKVMQVKPENCMYVGDAKNDVIAAQRANMMSIVANYGFIPKGENTKQWNSDKIIEHPEQLLNLLNIN